LRRKNYFDSRIFVSDANQKCESKVQRWVAISKIIVASIGAHPDDVELGMGGTLAKHSKRGDEIHIILCTLGIGGSSGDPKSREIEAEAAAKTLNAQLHILDFPVVKLHKPSIEFESVLKRTVDDINPYRLYTHSPFDYHQVHESVSECTINAAKDIQQVLFYEVISSTTPEFRANAYVDITDYLDRKIECLAHHSTQSRKLYTQALIIRSLAHTRYIMSKIGTKQEGMAEAFAIRKMIVIPNGRTIHYNFSASSSVCPASAISYEY
jgi:LmbE family N-acetylglucosaminyl deacetylase